MTDWSEVDLWLRAVERRWVGRITTARHDGRGWFVLHTRAGEFEGGARSVSYLMLQRLEPAEVVERVSPPGGVDGIIAYPGSRNGQATVAGGQVTTRRVRKRWSARRSAGPKARQKTTLPTAWATLKGSDVPARTAYHVAVWSL